MSNGTFGTKVGANLCVIRSFMLKVRWIGDKVRLRPEFFANTDFPLGSRCGTLPSNQERLKLRSLIFLLPEYLPH